MDPEITSPPFINLSTQPLYILPKFPGYVVLLSMSANPYMFYLVTFVTSCIHCKWFNCFKKEL